MSVSRIIIFYVQRFYIENYYLRIVSCFFRIYNKIQQTKPERRPLWNYES